MELYDDESAMTLQSLMQDIATTGEGYSTGISEATTLASVHRFNELIEDLQSLKDLMPLSYYQHSQNGNEYMAFL